MSAPVILYGGRFDPFHLGHLGVIKCAQTALPRHEVLVVPAREPWHKKVEASFEDRAEMAKLGCQGLDRTTVVDIEPGGQRSYTIDTIANLPEHEGAPVLLLGGDAFVNIGTWKNWRALLGAVNVAVVPRKPDGLWTPEDPDAAGLVRESLVDGTDGFAAEGGLVHVLRCEAPDVSSRKLRSMIDAGSGGWESSVPARVASYIKKGFLYGHKAPVV